MSKPPEGGETEGVGRNLPEAGRVFRREDLLRGVGLL
jgi:hypothetical protein